MFHCHCRDCQRSSGGPFASFLAVPKAEFNLVKGELRFYASPSKAGGDTRRGFCADCGSPILGYPDAAPDLAAIRSGSLDEPENFEPKMDVWISDAHVWDHMNPTLPKFDFYPV